MPQKLNLKLGSLLPPSAGAGLQPAQSPRLYAARLVRAGRILQGDGAPANIEILPDALQSAAHKFESCAVFLDHAGWFEHPSVRNWVGTVRNPIYDPNEKSIHADIEINTSTPDGLIISNLIDQLLSDDNPPDFGLSMVFYPVWSSPSSSQLRPG